MLWPLFARAPRHWFLENFLLSAPGAQSAFFLLRSVGRCFFFCSGPVPAPNGASPSPAFPRGRSKKKTPWVVFFFCSGPVPAPQRGFSFPCLSPGPEQKKNWVVFFFAAAPRSLRAWVAMPPPRRGGVFFCCGPAQTGLVFFFLLWPRPDAHSLTVGWGDFGKARVVFFFFCCGPAGSFETITKNVWGTTSGLKRPGGATAKKKHHFPYRASARPKS